MTGKNSHVTACVALCKLLIILIAFLFWALPVAAYAAEITYTGNGDGLRPSPSWFYEINAPCLFPAAKTTPLSSGNKVTVNYNPEAAGAIGPKYIFGGLSETGKVAGNSVILLDGRVYRNICGGFSNDGTPVDNNVTVSGGYIGTGVFGGMSRNGEVARNIVTFSAGVVYEGICGGWSETGNTAGNSVILLDGQIEGEIYGGYSNDGTPIDNNVTISGGSVDRAVFGGYSHNGDVTGNRVTINGGSVGQSISGGISTKGSILDNIVTINGGSLSANVYGGWGASVVAGNSVIISGGSLDRSVFGGCGENGDVAGNSVAISGGAVKGSLYGGESRGSATGNAVKISGGSIDNQVYGGYSYNSVSDNTVTISGGSMSKRIYGGFSVDGTAMGNTVTISGRPNLTEAHVFGGHTENLQKDAFTGNTLNLKSSSIAVMGVSNFEYYNFYLPESTVDGVVMLIVTEPADLKGTTVSVALQGGTKLRNGDKIPLIHSAAGVSFTPKNKSCKTEHDGVLYEFSIYTDKNNLWAKVTKISAAAK